MTENVKKLRIHNFKNIEHADIEPDGKSFVLKGENGSGKSAHIEALGYALGGLTSKLVKGVIRDGENSVFVFLDTGNLLITREYKDGKSKLIVRDQEGVEYKSPQGMLNDLVSKVTFNPCEFMNKSKKDQLEALRKLVDADGKIADLEKEHDRLFDLRKVANVEDKRLKAISADLPYDKDAPEELVSHSDLLKDYEGAKAIVDKHHKAQEKISEMDDKILKLEKEIEELDGHRRAAEHDLTDDNPDVEGKKKLLDNAESINERVRANQAKDKAATEALIAIEKAMNLDDKVKAKKAAINKAVTESDMPVEGMTFGDDCILLNNRELKSCSTGEQMVASMNISMALNKGLKTIMMQDASLLDPTMRKLALKTAREHKDGPFQLILEVVSEGTEVSIEIEGVE